MDDGDKRELQELRTWAAGQCALPHVIRELGPMSLWSKDAFERERAHARREALEEAANLLQAMEDEMFATYGEQNHDCAGKIRALIERSA